MKTLVLALSCFIAAEAQATPGLRYEKTVLKGVLTRAGGPGGRTSASNATIDNLCEQGYGTAFYLYPEENFKNPGVRNCANGSIEYKGGGFQPKSVRGVLAQVAKAANGEAGPVVMHCWNGWHAAGEAAAYALMQFCDYSGERAAQYWADNIGDKGNLPKYGSILKRIRKFQPFADLRVSDSAKGSICP